MAAPITYGDHNNFILTWNHGFSFTPVRRVAPQHTDRNVTTDYCDVTSPCI